MSDLNIYDRSALLYALQRCQTGEASCIYTLNLIEEAHEREVAKRDAALAEAEGVLVLAHDWIEPDEGGLCPAIVKDATHVNASIRAVLAKVRPLLPKPPIIS